MSTSWPWRELSAGPARPSRDRSSRSDRVVGEGTSSRSLSAVASRSSASAGSAARSRPTRQAATRRRAGGRGSRRRAREVGPSVAPSSSRSAATRPPAVVTTGDVASRRLGAVPARVRAARRPSRSGATHRSSSRADRTSGKVSATGPGPRTGPVPRSVLAAAVMGRLWSSHSRPSGPKAHSMSWGPPKTASAWRARPASWRSWVGESSPPAGPSRRRPRWESR